MRTLEIPYSEALLAASGQSPEELERDLQFWLAVKLFELKRLSLGKASEVAGMSRTHFMAELGRRGIPVVNLDEDQIEEEFRHLRRSCSSTAAS
mgnify:CR=1 FL=1